MTDRPVAQIRTATPNDAPALGQMHVASSRETYAGLLPDNMLSSLSVEARAAAWAKIMQEPPMAHSTMIYVAEYDDEIVGFGSCGAQRTENLANKGYDSGRTCPHGKQNPIVGGVWREWAIVQCAAAANSEGS